MEWHNFHPILGGMIFVMFAFQGISGIGSIDATEENRQGMGLARLHRWNGRALAAILLAAYTTGLLTVVLRGKGISAYPPHLINGTLLLVAATTAFFLARKYRITKSRGIKHVHITFGAFAIAFYLVQAVIGLGMLLDVHAI